VAVSPAERPIRLVVRDGDLARRRLTVFFRLILAIPVVVWLLLWGIAAFMAAIVLWLGILINGEPPESLHAFVAGYLRYWAHVSAYVFLAAEPWPGFRGSTEYPVDLEIDPPTRQSRWKTLFRLFLALPAILLASTLGGAPGDGGWQFGTYNGHGHGSEWRVWGGIGGVAAVCAFLTWFYALARRRASRGLRDLVAYSLSYAAQASGYLLLLTDRYPRSDPAQAEDWSELPPHPVRIVVDDPLERSRLTVFFRLLLAIPHLIWLLLWAVAAFFAAIAAWFAALVTGVVPTSLHRFLAAFVRYGTHVYAYLGLVAGRFPGFVGREGTYGVDLQIDPPVRQSRWLTLFRLFLTIPAFFVASALNGVFFVAAFLNWWYSLVTGRAPEGLRNLGAVCLRYGAQTDAYLLLLTPRYPSAAPLLERREQQPASELTALGEPY
jgi:Domain of unknown function (DUF4389)